jgi:glycyl-tRNA synthetase beta chain
VTQATLLVELLTEELPPKALRSLGERFRDALAAGLGPLFPLPHSTEPRFFATPRRLAVLIQGVHDEAPDVINETSGPPTNAKAEAVAGFAKKYGVAIDSLEKRKTPKGEVFVARHTTKGLILSEVLAQKVESALKALPVPKIMRWGAGEAQFVRPVHGLVMLHGAKVVPGSVLGLQSGNRTQGHRFMGKRELTIATADAYEATLRDEGNVIADFAARRSLIEKALQEKAKERRPLSASTTIFWMRSRRWSSTRASMSASSRRSTWGCRPSAWC